MFKFGHFINKDGTVYNPPTMKEYKEFIDSLREKAKCSGHLDYRCMYCNKCPSGEHFEWPPHKKNLDIQQHNLEQRYFKMHNPSNTSIIDLDLEVWENGEEDEYEVETKRTIFGFGLHEGCISFDLHLPQIYSELFDVYKDHADATMEDIKKDVVTVLHWKTNLDDKYTLLPIEMYDGYHAICCKEPVNIKTGPENMFTITMDMGDAKFRMADCFIKDAHFRFPKEVAKFIVAVTMERRIYK